MHVLIAGGDRVDAGKTTFAAGFVRWLPVDARVFKPRAGNDYWFDHDDVRRALATGQLHGKDVQRLIAAERAETPPAARNPVHRLWRPTPGATGLLGEPGRTALVDRVGAGDDRLFVVNGTVELPEPVASALPLGSARRVDSLSAFNEAMETVHAPALGALDERIRSATHAVVEAYGDVATATGHSPYDAVAVVQPSRVRLYDGDRWAVARRAATDTAGGRREIRTSQITGMLEPVSRHELQPAPASVRDDPDALADRYGDSYDRLWQLAHS